MKDIIIAIDGYSSCGKSTFARAIAERLGYTFIDSGAMYRAVTLYALRHRMVNADGSVDRDDLAAALPLISIRLLRSAQGGGQNSVFLNDEDVTEEIRLVGVSDNVSYVSELAEVRKHLVAQQREMGRNKAVVMDGRDIGTVVFPNAELKIFMTASPEIRAQRRYRELTEKGVNVSLQEVESNIRQRDAIDENRMVSPLRKAKDAVLLDNSHISVDEQMEWVMKLITSITSTQP
ncbi:MAG: (d)CMP kinase [Prevotellaceae bacterium]|jgi:cytidylate kinase|nr:(d)CMP kinase [Prevotellaceae bacterium]